MFCLKGVEEDFWIVVLNLQIQLLFPHLRLFLSNISHSISFYDDANLLIDIHIEYLDEIGLPTVVLGEGDGAREPLHPGGVVAHRV